MSINSKRVERKFHHTLRNKGANSRDGGGGVVGEGEPFEEENLSEVVLIEVTISVFRKK